MKDLRNYTIEQHAAFYSICVYVYIYISYYTVISKLLSFDSLSLSEWEKSRRHCCVSWLAGGCGDIHLVCEDHN